MMKVCLTEDVEFPSPFLTKTIFFQDIQLGFIRGFYKHYEYYILSIVINGFLRRIESSTFLLVLIQVNYFVALAAYLFTFQRW